MVRRRRPPPPQSLQIETRRPDLPGEAAPRDAEKKSPALGTIGDSAEAWLRGWKPQTHNFQIATELRQAFGSLSPRQLSPFALEAFVAAWKARYAPATIHGRTLALRRFLRLIDAGAGTQLRDVVRPARNPGPRKVVVQAEEAVKLFAQAPPWQRVWLLLCSQLALRNAEGRSIGPANYDGSAQTITFRKKGGDDHVLPVTPEIAAMFEAAPAAPEGCEDWTYTERWRGKKLSKAAIEHQWRKLKKQCGVRETLRVHDLRRTTAVALYELSKDLRAVSHLLGHTSISATCGYLANRDPQTLRPLLAQLRLPTEKIQ